MKFFSGGSGLRPFVLRLDPGDDLLLSLREFIAARGIRSGAVISGIGTLDKCRMHMVTTTTYPPVEVFPEWDEALELVSMQGIIASGAPHIHMTVSTSTAAVSGHLEEGCRILYLAEVLVVEFDADLVRLPDRHGVLHLHENGPAS